MTTPKCPTLRAAPLRFDRTDNSRSIAGVSGFRRWPGSETVASVMAINSLAEERSDLGLEEGVIARIVDGIAGTVAVDRRDRAQHRGFCVDQPAELVLVVANVEIAVGRAGHQQHMRLDCGERPIKIAIECGASADVAVL